MSQSEKKHPVLAAIAGIEVIKDLADAANVVMDKQLTTKSLALWALVIQGLHAGMDGEAMGIMIALIVDITHNGHSLHDIESIVVNQVNDEFSLELFFKDETHSTTTLH